MLKDIVNKTNVAESRAGVSVAGYEVPDRDEDDVGAGTDADEQRMAIKSEEGETAVISHLAALITSQGSSTKSGEVSKRNADKKELPELDPARVSKKKHDPVQAILAAAGVQYTHENSEVIGTSKIEAHISKQAEETLSGGADFDVKQGDRQIFMDDSQQQNGSGDYKSDGKDEGGPKIPFRYHPPDDVIRRQFCEMARWAGFESAVEFGLVVEAWTQAERRDCLDQFYSWRKEVISTMGNSTKQKSESSGQLKKEQDQDQAGFQTIESDQRTSPRISVVENLTAAGTGNVQASKGTGLPIASELQAKEILASNDEDDDDDDDAL